MLHEGDSAGSKFWRVAARAWAQQLVERHTVLLRIRLRVNQEQMRVLPHDEGIAIIGSYV
jgi:hypothetical protein